VNKTYLIKSVDDVDGHRRYENKKGYYEPNSENLMPSPKFVYHVLKSLNRHAFTILNNVSTQILNNIYSEIHFALF